MAYICMLLRIRDSTTPTLVGTSVRLSVHVNEIDRVQPRLKSYTRGEISRHLSVIDTRILVGESLQRKLDGSNPYYPRNTTVHSSDSKILIFASSVITGAWKARQSTKDKRPIR